MKERPILFNDEMVRAILDGRKTQTRRTKKLKKINVNPGHWQYQGLNIHNDHLFYATCSDPDTKKHQCEGAIVIKSPYGIPGDRLWVRENFYYIEQELEYVDVGIGSVPVAELQPETILYQADFEDPAEMKWKPSIHMRREYSRILLEVTNIRVERVQDISVEEVLLEGIPYQDFGCMCDLCLTQSKICPATKHGLILEFKKLWDSINEKKGFGWDKNPWIWVIEFDVVKSE